MNMSLSLDSINWLALGVCVLVGQVFLTVWFAALFAKPWAKEYGVEDPKQHTKAIPGYTYAVGALCVLSLSLGLALFQAALGVDSLGDGLLCGGIVALLFGVSTALPGYAFLRRYRAFALAMGAQTALILLLSVIIAVWK